MTPLAVFVRTLLKTSAIFIGVTAVFLNPTLDWSSRSPQGWGSVTAQRSPRQLAVHGLIDALKDSDATVRRQAVTSLGQIGDREAVPALIAVAADQDVEIRRRAVRALGQIGDDRALDTLTAALKDDDAAVRRHAAIAIAQVTGE